MEIHRRIWPEPQWTPRRHGRTSQALSWPPAAGWRYDEVRPVELRRAPSLATLHASLRGETRSLAGLTSVLKFLCA